MLTRILCSMLLIIAGHRAYIAWEGGGVFAMNQDPFEASFEVAVRTTGTRYTDARQAIINLGGRALRELRAKQTAAAGWQTGVVADILIGWLTKRDLFEQCTQYVRGRLPGRPPITGKFTAVQRANAIARLGDEVVPRLLEMLLKTRDYTAAEESAAIFGALGRIGDKRAVPPLQELMTTESDDAIKTMAAGALGQLRDARAVQPLRAVLLDRVQSTALRATAAMSLGELGDSGALVALQDILLDRTNAPELRRAAARAIDKLGDPRASEALVQTLTKTEDLVLLQVVVEALGKLGNRAHRAPLEDLANDHGDEFIREAAREAAEKVLSRQP